MVSVGDVCSSSRRDNEGGMTNPRAIEHHLGRVLLYELSPQGMALNQAIQTLLFIVTLLELEALQRAKRRNVLAVSCKENSEEGVKGDRFPYWGDMQPEKPLSLQSRGYLWEANTCYDGEARVKLANRCVKVI